MAIADFGIFILGYIGFLILMTNLITHIMHSVAKSEKIEEVIIRQKIIECHKHAIDINGWIYENVFRKNRCIHNAFVCFVALIFIIWYVTIGIIVIFAFMLIGTYIYGCMHCLCYFYKNTQPYENVQNDALNNI